MSAAQEAACLEDRAVRGGGGSLAEAFAEVCARDGGRVAVSFGEANWTYAELDAASDRVASGLVKRGVAAGQLVAICVGKGAEMIVAMLGVVKAGGAYLPLDAGYPEARIAETVADAGAGLVVGRDVSVEELMRGGEGPWVPVAVDGEATAYVIYTSGSTGKPKGVEVSHKNVLRLLSETDAWFGFGADDVWTMFHSFAFDFSVWEIWGALLRGGRLVIVPFEVSRDPEAFRALLVRERVTVLNQTPSAFALLDAADAAAMKGRGGTHPNDDGAVVRMGHTVVGGDDGAIVRMGHTDLSLRVVVFGGEALQPGLLRGWFGRHGDAVPVMVNMYGITETTVHVTYRRMLAKDLDERESLMGGAIPDMQVHLLDEELRPVADGVEGEICVGGGGVAKGYLGRAELTAERFVADPFGGAGARLYRSGDVGRRRGDGELVYCGRRDGQVKVNGFRVETGEVEAAVLGHPAVAQACVVASGEPKRLVAYYVWRAGAAGPGGAEMSAFLGGRLPAQMMPAFYVELRALPLTGNGKVDRAALPAPEVRRVGAVVTGTEMERVVAGAWAEALGGEGFGVEENFFDVGGTSLLLIAVREKLKAALGREIPITLMFEYTTVRALAGKLAGGVDKVKANSVQELAAKQREAFARAKARKG